LSGGRDRFMDRVPPYLSDILKFRVAVNIERNGAADDRAAVALHVRRDSVYKRGHHIRPAGVSIMPLVYVATSKTFAQWASDVGLGKHVYKVGVAAGTAEDAIKALNDAALAGASDWRLMKKQEADDIDEAAAIERLAKKEKQVDPAYYPRLRGATGIFRVKVANVANSLLVKRALAGEEEKVDKVKASDIATYLIQNALQ
jgi:hypothetical protein